MISLWLRCFLTKCVSECLIRKEVTGTLKYDLFRSANRHTIHFIVMMKTMRMIKEDEMTQSRAMKNESTGGRVG